MKKGKFKKRISEIKNSQRKLLIIVLSLFFIVGCSSNSKEEKFYQDKVLIANAISTLHENITFFNKDSLVKWNFYNGVNLGFMKAFPINENRDSLEFFAIENDKELCVFFSNEKYYVFKLSEVIPFDSAYVQIE